MENEFKAKVIYEVTVNAGKYFKDGKEKTRYQNIGSIIETKKGMMLKLNAMPICDETWQGWAYLFEPKPFDQKFAAKQFSNGFPDDIDF
jgi:hypothetical protein